MDMGFSRGVTEWLWEQASGQEAWMARPCWTCQLHPAPLPSRGLPSSDWHLLSVVGWAIIGHLCY